MTSDETPEAALPPEEELVDPAAAVDDETVAVEPTARQRLRRALLHPGPGQGVAAVLLAILGAAGVTQVRLAGTDSDYAGMRQADLIQALNGLQASSRRTEQDIRDLERTRDALRSNSDKTAAALAQARTDLAGLGVLAGTVPAKGPGVRITVTPPDSGLSINLLLDGIEELRDAGAEAMEINDAVRIVAQSSFEAADGGINVDGRVLKPPFVIDAIGDPDSLDAALNFTGGFVDDVHLDDGKVVVKPSQHVDIEVLRNQVKPQYAEPVS
jgi:uncharacterized protein YlxW (UPF0749 family)